MFSDALLALQQTFSPLLRNVLLKSVGLAILLLVALAFALQGAVVYFLEIPSYPWIEMTLAIITGLGIVFGALYLMPAVSALVAGLFLDDVAEKVEKASYPQDPPGVAQPVAQQLLFSLRFFGLVLVVNLCALLLLLVPGVNLIIFYVANAYLISREYFEMAAMRYRTPHEARALRQAHATTVFVAGLMLAPLLFIPILNFITPVVGTAFMVHLHRRVAPLPAHRTEDGALMIEGKAL
ncbi:sulfate transporter family protein [Xanthobacter sp. TB0136]|uniref:sulfate transporter family protein n=1 Tax=Xanthobacter sp. TB0136 TaxID=3459177 RepID=UPI0040394B44